MKQALKKISLIVVAVAVLLAALSCQATRYRLDIGINPPATGTVSGSASGDMHDSGASVTLTATAAPGYEFVEWSGDASGTDEALAVTMTSNKNVVANFAPTRYTLSVAVSPTAGGSVSPTGGAYDSGAVVTLTATPASGYQFLSWSGDASGTSATVVVAMTSNKSVIANFGTTRYNLSVTVTPSASGTVNPSGGMYESYTLLALTATPAPGFRFGSWSGDAFGTSPTIGVTMDSNKNITAIFTPIQYSLFLAASPTQGGTVSPASGSYDAGAAITLTATPGTCYEFASWSGDAAGTSPRATVTMNSDVSVVANFSRLSQHFAKQMPPGTIVGSYATYHKDLPAGEQVEGSVELTGAPELTDWSFEFSFQVIAPDGQSVQTWSGNWMNNNRHDFSFVATQSGTYQIQIVHYSSFTLNLEFNVSCPGWLQG